MNERSNTSIPLRGEGRDKLTDTFTFTYFLQYVLQYRPLEFDQLNNISLSPSIHFLSILMLSEFRYAPTCLRMKMTIFTTVFNLQCDDQPVT